MSGPARPVWTLLGLGRWSPNRSGPVRTSEIPQAGPKSGEGVRDVRHIGLRQPGPSQNPLRPFGSRTSAHSHRLSRRPDVRHIELVWMPREGGATVPAASLAGQPMAPNPPRCIARGAISGTWSSLPSRRSRPSCRRPSRPRASTTTSKAPAPVTRRRPSARRPSLRLIGPSLGPRCSRTPCVRRLGLSTVPRSLSS